MRKAHSDIADSGVSAPRQPICKPSYSLTRSAFWVSFALAWLLMGALVLSALLGEPQAVAMSSIVFPSLVLLVAALLGIHRAFGSVDMRTIAGAGSEEKQP